MKKQIVKMFVMTAVMFILCQNTSYAREVEILPGDMVYADKETQEYVYNTNMLNEYSMAKELDLEIVKESITPLYAVDLVQYAETGEFAIKPYGEKWDKERTYYIAKIVYRTNQEYAGYYISGIDTKGEETGGGIAIYEGETNGTTMASPSYADHARRIQTIMGSDSVIPVSNVRLIMDRDLGVVFYVMDGDKEMIIPVGKLVKDEEGEMIVQKYPEQVDVAYSFARVGEIAEQRLQKRKAFLKEKEEWEREHPGETYAVMGDNSISISESYVTVASVDNISNVRQYLNIVDITKEERADNNRHLWIYIATAISVVFAGGVGIFLGVKKHREIAEQ